MSNKYKIPDNQISMFDVGLIKDDAPSMPVFDKSRCEARLINYETAARIAETYHYAHRVPPMVITLGLFVDDILAGICAYTDVFTNIAQSICGDEYSQKDVLELARLFIFDWAGRNSESWLIGQSFKWLRNEHPGVKILLSYSDTNENHLGIIYQATNWLYTGMSLGANGREYQLSNGKIVTRRARQFTKNGNGLDILPWQEIKELYPGIKKVQSSPKHRYVYFLGSKSQRKKLRRALKWPVLPYPKITISPAS